MTGVAKMSISNIERAVKDPRPSTVARIEAGLGWRAGSFYRLADAGNDDSALDDLVDSFTSAPAEVQQSLPVQRIRGAEVLTQHVEAYVDMIDALIDQLPPSTSPRYETVVLAALSRCARSAVLTSTSWRMAAQSDRETASRLFRIVRDLESKRKVLLDLVPESTAARFDAACRKSALSEALISVLTGLTAEEIWSVRSGSSVPEGANGRIASFIKAVDSGA